MDQYRGGGFLHLRALFLASGDACGAGMHGGAVTLDGSHLGRDRAFRHHHVAGDAAGPRRQRQRGAMVARRMGDHAGARFRFGQRPDRVAGATELERAHALQVFGLEMELGTGQRVQRARTQHRGDQRMRCDPRGGGQEVFENGGWGRHARKINVSGPASRKRSKRRIAAFATGM